MSIPRSLKVVVVVVFREEVGEMLLGSLGESYDLCAQQVVSFREDTVEALRTQKLRAELWRRASGQELEPNMTHEDVLQDLQPAVAQASQFELEDIAQGPKHVALSLSRQASLNQEQLRL